MRTTAKEFLESKGHLGPYMMTRITKVQMHELLDEYATLQWNAAIEAASESAEIEKINECALVAKEYKTYFRCAGAFVSIHKQSILKLKK